MEIVIGRCCFPRHPLEADEGSRTKDITPAFSHAVLLLYLWPHQLAIVRYNYRSVEYVRGLRQSQIIGYAVEILMVRR